MTTRITFIRTVLGAVVVGTCVLTSCAAQESVDVENSEATAVSPTQPDVAAETHSGDVLVAEVDESVEFEVCIEAEAMDGATVEWLDDVVVEEQELEGVAAETVEVDGQEVEISGVPSIVIPERVGQAGCVIEYPAAGGCLPAVEISGSFIPGYRIPKRGIEEVQLPDGPVAPEAIQPGIESSAVDQAGAFQDEVCQTETENAQAGDRVAYVKRPYIMRPYIQVPHSRNAYVRRPNVTTQNGDTLSFAQLPSYTVPSMMVGSAMIGSDMLESYRIEGTDHTEYSEHDDAISYTTQGDVLFDSDNHQRRRDSEAELQAIANDIAQHEDVFRIRVEGHTDDVPTDAYTDNNELSKQRANSVVTWLKDNTDVADDAISAKGMGDDHPRAANSSDDGRQQNRRVVITIIPDDYDPKIDYEVDDSPANDE